MCVLLHYRSEQSNATVEDAFSKLFFLSLLRKKNVANL